MMKEGAGRMDGWMKRKRRKWNRSKRKRQRRSK